MAFPTFSPVNTFSQGQVNNAQGDYGTQQQSALTANQNLKNYQQNMQDPSKMYSENLGNTEGSLGFDPKQILQANQQLAVTQNQMANLPQSIAAQGGGYGVTGGQMANNYAQSAGNLHTALADQGNNLNALQSTYSNALNQAGKQTEFGVQGQQMQLGALKDIYQNAYQQQQTSLQNMQFLQDQFQKQGQWNTDQQRQYAASYAQYQQALASANAANAQAGLFGQQSKLIGAQLSGLSAPTSFSQTPAGKLGMPDLSNYQSSTPTPSAMDYLSGAPEGINNFMNGLGRAVFPQSLFGR